jgi:hypothetical protein
MGKSKKQKSNYCAGIVGPVALRWSRYVLNRTKQRNINCRKYQLTYLHSCLRRATNTQFGSDHGFKSIRTHRDFQEAVPVREYEGYDGYWQQVLDGKPDVTWPGRTVYLVESSGTTAGKPKLLPVTRAGTRNAQLGSVRSGLFFMADQGSARLLQGRQLVIGGDWQGRPHPGGARIFKGSGLGPGTLPRWVRDSMVLPSAPVANTSDFEEKIRLLVKEALGLPVSQVSSTPVWLIAFCQQAAQAAGLTEGQDLKEIWPELEVCLFSGAPIAAYRHILTRWLGPLVALWEQYGASEAVMAVKESAARDDLLVLADNGTFFEFVPVGDYGKPNPRRLCLWEVEAGVDYVVVVTNNNGLFGYVLGDIIRFTTLRPYRLVVAGRTKFFLNTVGEHMTQHSVERALAELQQSTGVEHVDYTVGPGRCAPGMVPYHEWAIEFVSPPNNLAQYCGDLDRILRTVNSDYRWYRAAKGLGRPRVTPLPSTSFRRWVREYRGSDPQVKIPRLSNDRTLIEQLELLR